MTIEDLYRNLDESDRRASLLDDMREKADKIGFVAGNGDGSAEDKPVDRLENWLRTTFENELPGTLAKAVTYGSADLEVMGDAMGVMMPQIAHDRKLRLLAAITFYQLGKVARQIGALRDGREPPTDTNYDMHIYGLMGLKIQETGEWLSLDG